LDPRIVIAHSGLAFSYFFAGQYDEALLWVKTALRETPKHLPTLRIAMACYALSGRSVEAREACSRVMQIDPAQRISNIRNTPFRRDEDVAKLAEGFRLAGMPE
jgi:tetratricopeptide (TPR) repeat protein